MTNEEGRDEPVDLAAFRARREALKQERRRRKA